MSEEKPTLLQRFLIDRELSPEERRSVLEDLFVFGKDNQAPYLARMTTLLVLSTIIAAAGLLADSAAVVIGAMLVAPLMGPVLAAAGAVVMGWPKRFYTSLWLVGAMGLGAMVLSSLVTVASPELVFLPEQVLARTRPTYFDLLIALAAGAAGAYTITRKESGAIPGVAVAVALLPPLASAGILFTTGEGELGLRAVVLFLTNLVAMVLSGALTFLAVGVSPTRARRESARFLKNKIWLFVLLTALICIPLWFYSEKVLYNAHYKAAKSVVLQQWLAENQMTLVDVDIFREQRTLFLSLEGPNPPINIGQLHERLVAAHDLEDEQGFHIEYTWAQRVSGKWPLESVSILEHAAQAREESGALVARTWEWTTTQYEAGRAAAPGASERITLFFDHRGKFELYAGCGRLTGKYRLHGRALDLEFNRNWLSGCRKDEALNLMVADLERARDVDLQDQVMRIILAGDAGIMFFEQR